MSGFNARRGEAMYPNIANLNAIPSDPSDYNLYMQRHQDGYELEQELALFTNTQFFDFDQNISPDGFENTRSQPPRQNFDLLADDFQIPDLQLHSNLNHGQNQNLHQHNLGHFPQFPPTNTSSPSSSSTAGTLAPGEKRKIDSLDPSASPSGPVEETTRVAAEEDKRRRNTAASARFRAKKKQREEAMEKTAKEMTEKVNLLESRIAKLEMENKLLKDLITEKGGKDVDVSELLKRLAKSPKDAATIAMKKEKVDIKPAPVTAAAGSDAKLASR